MSSDSLYSPFFITIAVPPATSTGSAAKNPTAACRGLEPRSRAAAFHRREMASRVVRVAQVSRWPAPNRCVRSATSCFSASSRSRGSICRQFRWYSAKTSAAGIGRWGSRFHVMLRSPQKAAGAMDCGLERPCRRCIPSSSAVPAGMRCKVAASRLEVCGECPPQDQVAASVRRTKAVSA